MSLYYLRARYYNAGTGRFMSRDPEDGKAKDPASLHKYLYAGGDPVNRIDPRGRADLVEFSAIVVQKVENVVGMEMYSVAEEVAMCKLFDLFMEEVVDLKLPWWYCELGAQ